MFYMRLTFSLELMESCTGLPVLILTTDVCCQIIIICLMIMLKYSIPYYVPVVTKSLPRSGNKPCFNMVLL